MEECHRLRVTRIPLLPRQVNTYFGLSQSDSIDDIEEGYSSDCFVETQEKDGATPLNHGSAAERTNCRTSASSTVPLFQVNIPNSPFNSTYNSTIAAVTESTVQCSQPSVNAPASQRQQSEEIVEKQSDQLTFQSSVFVANDKETSKLANKWWLKSDRRVTQSGSMLSATKSFRISGAFGVNNGEMSRKSLPEFRRCFTQVKSSFLIESDKPEVGDVESSEFAVPYLRPHSPISMGDAARQNESLKHIRLPSPIRVKPVVAASPRSARPIVPRPSFAPQNPTLNQIGRLYSALQSPSILVPLPGRKRFTAFATPCSSNTTKVADTNETGLSSPSRNRRSALVDYGSDNSTPLTSTPLSIRSSSSSGRRSFALTTGNSSCADGEAGILAQTVNEIFGKTTKPSTTTNGITPLKSVLKRRFTAGQKTISNGASEKNGVLSEIFINYSTPPRAEKADRRKSVSFQQALPNKEKNVRIGEERYPLFAVGGDSGEIVAGGENVGKSDGGTRHRLSAFVDYNSSFSTIFEEVGTDDMTDGGLDDSVLIFASPCAKQIVLKRGEAASYPLSGNETDNRRKLLIAVDKECSINEATSTPEGILDSLHTSQRSSELLNSTIDVFDSLTVNEENGLRSGADVLTVETRVFSPPAELSEPFSAGAFDDTIDSPARRRTGGGFFNSSIFTTNDWNESGANNSCGYDSNKNKSFNSTSIVSRPSGGDILTSGENDSMDLRHQRRISSTSMESSFAYRLSCGTCDESSSSVRHFVLRKDGAHCSPEYVLPAPKIKCSEVDSPSAGLLRRSKRNRVARLAPGQQVIYRYGDDGTRTLVGVADLIVRDRQLKKYGCADPLVAADREWELKRFKKLQKGKKKEVKDRWHKTIKC